MKKLILMALAALLALALLPVSALAAEGDSGTAGDYNWTELADGTLELWNYSGTDITVVVPASLATPSGERAVSRLDSTFRGNTTLQSVEIPASIPEVVNNAFGGCTALETVTLHSGLTTLGNYVFQECTALEAIVLPDSVTSMGEQIFQNCTGLFDVTLPGGLTRIPGNAFLGCTSLLSVDIPDTVETIGGYAFKESGLTSVTLPSGLKTLEYNCFENCLGLNSVSIPSGVETIDYGVFLGCSNLTGVSLPSGLTSLGESAFEECTSLESIAIPSGVSTLEYGLFSGCTNLRSVALSEGLTAIGDRVFYGCGALTEITIPSTVTSMGFLVFGSSGIARCVMLCRSFAYNINMFGTTPIRDAGNGIWGYAGSGAQGAATAMSIPFYGGFLVSFEENGGSAVGDQFITTGSAATKPADPARSHHLFGGWYTTPGLETAYVFSTPVTADTALHARWTELTLSSSVANGHVYTGGRITLTPNIGDGEWGFDDEYLSREGGTFTALKAGTTTVAYTVDGVSVTYDVTIADPALILTMSPADGKIYQDGRVTITPNIEGGEWRFNAAYLSRDGYAFTGLRAGTVRVAYTVGGQSASVDVTVSASRLPSTGQDGTPIYILGGLALCFLAAGAVFTRRRAIHG